MLWSWSWSWLWRWQMKRDRCIMLCLLTVEYASVRFGVVTSISFVSFQEKCVGGQTPKAAEAHTFSTIMRGGFLTILSSFLDTPLKLLDSSSCSSSGLSRLVDAQRRIGMAITRGTQTSNLVLGHVVNKRQPVVS
ncbi:hypothetical protein VTL71DRAFT_3222 [Oculimacula yallundae]|uniref:Secreted protein n=1 Tax=Oculimacula yallundae TaxID=86028 RepID=A0ABR4C7Q6_9HELO